LLIEDDDFRSILALTLKKRFELSALLTAVTEVLAETGKNLPGS
jgi:hypothetical protein